MLNNPEFQRQLWLNWRPSLALWTVLLTSLILALPWVLSGPREQLANVGLTALFGLWGATVVYASVLASRSLSEEVRDNTWDWQRLSALSPWQMAWGKLLGATLPAWLYAALFGMTSIGVASVWDMLWGSDRAWHLVALAILWGLGMQTWAMNTVLVRWESRVWQRRGLGLVVLLGFLPAVVKLVGTFFESDHMPWWGHDLGQWGTAYVLGAVTVGVGLLALWRQLCERLDVATLPWAWPVGLVVISFASAGLWHTEFGYFWPHLAGWALVASALIGLQHMASHARAWHQVQWSVQQGRWQAAAAALPLWPVSWLLAVLAAMVAWGQASTTTHGWWLLLASAQLLREGLILTGFALQGARWKSPMVVFGVTWLVINVLLPLLALGALGSVAATVLQPLVVLLGDAAPQDVLPRAWAWVTLAGQLLLALLWVVWAARSSQDGRGVSQHTAPQKTIAP